MYNDNLYNIDMMTLQCFYKHDTMFQRWKWRGSWNITWVFAFFFSFILKRPSNSGINESSKAASAWEVLAWKTSGFVKMSDE